MMITKLQQTLFQIEKLRNVVNVTGCSAYQIFTSPEKQLGLLGSVVDPGTLIAANEEIFADDTAQGAVANAPSFWFRKLLAALQG